MSVYGEFEYEQPDMEFESYETGQLNEEMESAFARDLLEVTSEAELEEFLGRLFRNVVGRAKSFMRSDVGQAVGGILKNVAKSALPMVGSAIGGLVVPGAGNAIGSQLGSMASSLLDSDELETMDAADADIEAARRYVRWATGTVLNGMRAPEGVSPRTAARDAAVASARRNAPALLSARQTTSQAPSQWQSSRRVRAKSEPQSYAPAWPTPPERTCACGRLVGSDSAGTLGQPSFYDGSDDAVSGLRSQKNRRTQRTQDVAPSSPRRSGKWYRQGANTVVIVDA